jgi:hypothetical protein
LGKFQAGWEQASGEVSTLVTEQGQVLRRQALDGKTVCGASAHGELIHLVSLVRRESGLVLDQDKATVKLHERRVAGILTI